MSIKTNLTFVLIVIAQSVLSQSFTGDTWADVKAAKSGSISLAYVETPGFVYKDQQGNLTGICIDIIRDFVSWVNMTRSVTLTYKFVGDGSNFNRMYGNTKTGRGGVFGLGNITITNERKQEVKFSPPFITNTAILISHSQVPALKKIEDISTTFAGMTAYTAKGTINEKRTLELKEKYFPNMQIAATTTSLETLEKVVSDSKGFAYLDLAFYIEAIQTKKNIKRHAVADKAAEQFGIIMPATSDWDSLMEEFFKANGGYVNSKAYKTILLKHLGEAGTKFLQAVR